MTNDGSLPAGASWQSGETRWRIPSVSPDASPGRRRPCGGRLDRRVIRGAGGRGLVTEHRERPSRQRPHPGEPNPTRRRAPLSVTATSTFRPRLPSSCGTAIPSRPRCATAGSTPGASPTTRASSGPCSGGADLAGEGRLPSTFGSAVTARRRSAERRSSRFIDQGCECRRLRDLRRSDARRETPVFTIADARHALRARRGANRDTDLHSGMYGGAALSTPCMCWSRR